MFTCAEDSKAFTLTYWKNATPLESTHQAPSDRAMAARERFRQTRHFERAEPRESDAQIPESLESGAPDHSSRNRPQARPTPPSFLRPPETPLENEECGRTTLVPVRPL